MTKDWFDILEKEFDHPAVVLWRAVELRQLAQALADIPLKEPILDLGCAEGKIARLLLDGYRVIGLDNTWELLHKSPRSAPYRGLTLGDAVSMPFRAERFGSVFSNCVIEHIPDLPAVLGEVGRVLAGGGYFIFTVPSASFGEYLSVSSLMKAIHCNAAAGWYARSRNASLNHFHCYDHDRWRQLLQERGFTLNYYKYYLGRRVTVLWDLLAIFWRFASCVFPSSLRQRLNKMLIKRLKSYYNISSSTGSGLLIVAQKEATGGFP